MARYDLMGILDGIGIDGRRDGKSKPQISPSSLDMEQGWWGWGQVIINTMDKHSGHDHTNHERDDMRNSFSTHSFNHF